MIRGAIFDFDGTLFDSMSIWDTVGDEYLRSIGKQAKENLRETLKPMSLYQAACYLKAEYALVQTPDEIMAAANAIVEDFYVHTILPKAGAAAFVERLRAHGVKLCIATATDRALVQAALCRCGMDRLFSELFTCTEVGHGKDEPMIFRQALQYLHTDRANTVVFEDAYHAIQTAKNDGFLTVGVFDAHESNGEGMKRLSDFFLTDYTQWEAFWSFAQAR